MKAELTPSAADVSLHGRAVQVETASENPPDAQLPLRNFPHAIDGNRFAMRGRLQTKSREKLPRSAGDDG